MSSDDKIAFTKRLKQALLRGNKSITTGTQLANQFNLRYRGESVSQQTAHKWLNSQAIPMDDKIEVLAEWLDVPFSWLRHGELSSDAIKLTPLVNPVTLTEIELMHIQKLRILPDHQRELIENLLSEFAYLKLNDF